MGLPDMDNVPESGAVFTLGRSRFADNVASHFFIRKDPVVYVTCGDEHSAVICQSGRLFVFGSNDWGQLGLGHKNHISKPSCVKVLKPDKVTHVACGRAHSLICTEERKIFTCGSDQEGQLGRGSSAFGDSSSSPVLVHDCEIAGTRVVGLAAGSHHSMLLTNDGAVLVWGSNLEGQLGLSGISGLVNEPTRVPIPEPVKRISAGYYHSAFLTESGRIYVCGESESGKLGIDVSFSTQVAPKQIQLPFPAVDISCGGHHTLVLTENGNLYCAGSNASGQLGMGSDVTEVQTPKLLPCDALHDDSIVQIACGESHSAVLTGSGKLFTCGDGRHGKLGLEENENNVHELTYAAKYQELFVSNVACGGCHTILVGRKRETIDRPQRVPEPVQLDSALPKKNTLPPLKLPATRMQSELGAEGPDTSQPPNIPNEKNDSIMSPTTMTTIISEDLATKNESSKEVSDTQLSFAVENKQEAGQMDIEENERNDNGREASNIVGGLQNDEDVRSSSPRKAAETEITTMIKDGNDETSAPTDPASCQHQPSPKPVEGTVDTAEDVHSDRAVYHGAEQVANEITRINSKKSPDRRSTTSQKTRSANSKSGTDETVGMDIDNSSGTVSKLRAENLPDDADVVQSPAPPTGKTVKLSKDKRQARSKNGAETCQGTHPRAKSKTCHIL